MGTHPTGHSIYSAVAQRLDPSTQGKGSALSWRTVSSNAKGLVHKLAYEVDFLWRKSTKAQLLPGSVNDVDDRLEWQHHQPHWHLPRELRLQCKTVAAQQETEFHRVAFVNTKPIPSFSSAKSDTFGLIQPGSKEQTPLQKQA